VAVDVAVAVCAERLYRKTPCILGVVDQHGYVFDCC